MLMIWIPVDSGESESESEGIAWAWDLARYLRYDTKHTVANTILPFAENYFTLLFFHFTLTSQNAKPRS